MGFVNIFNYKKTNIQYYFIIHILNEERPTWEDAMNLEVDAAVALRPSADLWSQVIEPGWSQEPMDRPSMDIIHDYFFQEGRAHIAQSLQ
jgi:hypothetical protein